MGATVQRTVVVSAVNIRKGGTLTILRQCLSYLSTISDNYRVIALVHKRELCDYDGIEYIEMPDTIKGWRKRLWCEYVTMNHISKKLENRFGEKVYLWLSLHDTTPRVDAEHRAVYCQTSFPFFKWRFQDFEMDFKIPIFAMFTRFAYQLNVHKNDYLIVQADWLKKGLSKMLHVAEDKFIVAPPAKPSIHIYSRNKLHNIYTFFYASTPDCHKNFETLCKASKILEEQLGQKKFKVILTVKGDENKYARWLYDNWGNIDSITFEGFMNKERLFDCYSETDCFIFPSRIETWGLPISEFMITRKPMLLSDLPYAHETAVGSKNVAFFNPLDYLELSTLMRKMIEGNTDMLMPILENRNQKTIAESWESLFEILLK